MTEVNELIETITNKERKIRYKALERIGELSRSNKREKKEELLNVLHTKAASVNWEERYVSMYAISRYMWKNDTFQEFQRAYSNVLQLLEDEDGRVRVAAFNALERFREFFIAYMYGMLSDFNRKDVIKIWFDSLIRQWDKAKNTEQGKKQIFMMRCVDVLFRPDMEEHLNNKEYEKYVDIWDKLQELEIEYRERAE